MSVAGGPRRTGPRSGRWDFDRAIALTPVVRHVDAPTSETAPRPAGEVPAAGDTRRFELKLDSAWSSLVGIHGGYLAAVATRGAELTVPGRPARTVVTSFLRTGTPGAASLTTTIGRHGRSLSTVEATLVQDHRPVIVSRVTLMDPADGLDWPADALQNFPAFDDCVRVDPPSRVGHFGQADFVLDPTSLPFTGGERALVRGWFRPLDDRPVDSAWLAMASDWFPPAAFVRVEPPVGGVSVDMTTHIHLSHTVLADDDWLAASFEVSQSADGLAIEHGWIADADGVLLAESMQTRLTSQAAAGMRRS